MLHILNGDATRPQFERSAIAGDIMIWREMLVEGPALYPLLSEVWFETRRNFINQAYKPDDISQVNGMRLEFEKLLELSAHEEIVLWFEYDLFCQINMHLHGIVSVGARTKQNTIPKVDQYWEMLFEVELRYFCKKICNTLVCE